MKSNDKLKKKNNIKNCTCYYFDYITKFEDFYLDNILYMKYLIDEKSCDNISAYNISYKT